MPLYLKQSTQVNVPVGPLYDSTDFITEKTDVAYNAAGIDVNVIKGSVTAADVTLADSAGDGYWRHVSNGNYAVTLSTTDTNTLGNLRVTFKATGVLDWWQDFEVVPAAVYDSLVAGSDKLPVDVQEVSSDETAANNLEAAFDGTGYAGGTTKQIVEVNTKTGFSLADGSITAATIATDAIDGDAVAASAVSEIQSGLATSSSITTLDGKIDTVDGVVDAIKLKTDTIPANPAAVGDAMTLTADYDAAKSAAAAGAQMDLVNAPNATAVAAIQSGLATSSDISSLNDFDPATEEVNVGSVKGVAVTGVDDFKADVSGLAQTGEAATALTAYDPPTKAELDAAVAPLATSAEITALNDFDPATDVVAHVTLVDTVTTNTDMRGTDGAELSGAAATAVGTLNDLSYAEAQAAAAAALTAYDAATGTDISSLSIPTAADNADAVWNEATADHQTAGSTGKALTDAQAAGDPWATALPGAYSDGSAGHILGTNLDATVSSRSTLTAAQVWANGTRTLSSFGTLVADVATAVWAAVTRTITGGTVSTVSDKSGYSLAADQEVNVTKVGGTAVSGPDDLKADVSALSTAVALSAVSTKVDTVDAVADAIKLKTDNLPASPAAVGSAMTLSAAERTAIVTAMLAGTITYPDGSTKTLEGLLEEVWATTAGDTNIVSLVQSFLWPDGATVALTYAIDDADAPTSRLRQ